MKHSHAYDDYQLHNAAEHANDTINDHSRGKNGTPGDACQEERRKRTRRTAIKRTSGEQQKYRKSINEGVQMTLTSNGVIKTLAKHHLVQRIQLLASML